MKRTTQPRIVEVITVPRIIEAISTASVEGRTGPGARCAMDALLALAHDAPVGRAMPPRMQAAARVWLVALRESRVVI
jgi:hypothetical protein